MGIQDFSKTFQKSGEIKFNDIKGKKIAVDAHIEIYRSSGIQHISGLLNPAGEPTQHIRTTLSNMLKMLSCNISAVWCFDSRVPKLEKEKTIQERKKIRQTAEEKSASLELEIKNITERIQKIGLEQVKAAMPDIETELELKKSQLNTLKGRNVSRYLDKYVSDVIFILDKLGIPYSFAPDTVEAEQLGAHFCKTGLTDGVMTTDTDALAFGAPWIMKKVQGKTGVYELYEIKKILTENKITMPQFREICVTLGSDYAPKTSGVGPKTVVKKIINKSVTFSAEQKRAIEIFSTDPIASEPEIIRPVRSRESINTLIVWLTEIQGFNEVKLRKDLEFITKTL